jgi:hypothetical protein
MIVLAAQTGNGNAQRSQIGFKQTPSNAYDKGRMDTFLQKSPFLFPE